MKLNNPFAVSKLNTLSTSINWTRYFDGLGVTELDTIIVEQPAFIKKMEEILSKSDVELWKSYLTYQVISNYSSYLDAQLVSASFDFYGKELRGVTAQRERWKRVLSTTNGYLGEAIGKLYVEEYFPPEAKEIAKKMVGHIRNAMKARINNLDWMTAETKEKAQEKLSHFTVKIGYPDSWKDYSDMDIKTIDQGGSYAQNVISGQHWEYVKELEKLNKPVDKTEWGMNPQTVNAYYNPQANEIVFPAAILQPPFFDFNADAPVNYGGIGAVIGHEISHGFDDQGAQFDADGNLVNWWSDADNTAFTERGKRLISQFDTVEVLPDVYINGKLTLGENIGDLGGVNLAWDALQAQFAENGKTKEIDGLSPGERFFISWGTVWRTKFRDEALRTRISTDPHSPGMYRAYMPLKNIDAFYTVFNIQPTDSLYIAPEDRVRIW